MRSVDGKGVHGTPYRVAFPDLMDEYCQLFLAGFLVEVMEKRLAQLLPEESPPLG
jgi:hypothetical protein